MRERAFTLQDRLHLRRCVVCGYDGQLLNDGRVPRCPHCGCDLVERPARSYAEMEGLEPRRVALRPPPVSSQRLAERWLAFLFLLMLGGVAAVALCAELLAARA